MRTRLSICRRKRRFASVDEAIAQARADGLALWPYRCEHCWRFHLTSRSKGRRLPRPAALQASDES